MTSRFLPHSCKRSLHTLRLCVGLLAACGEQAGFHAFNEAPVAEAMVVHPSSGMVVQAAPDGSLSPVTFPFSGSPITILLDGRNSSDPDGEIREYRWLSGTRVPGDAGVMPPFRRVAEGQPAGWPGDEVTTPVVLGAGVWAFTLWVRDDDGAWSRPDTIRFIIGSQAPTATLGDAGTLAPGLMDGGTAIDSGRP